LSISRDGRLAGTEQGVDVETVFVRDAIGRQVGFPPIRAAGTELDRGSISDQRTPFRVVGIGKQRSQWRLVAFRIAIPGFPVGESELGCLDYAMHELRPDRIHLG